MSKQNYNIWWGPPKKFSTNIAERKITWLELFYDLVYVIVISKITYYLAEHPSRAGLFDYASLFAMTFWGWFNGSLHHDLHGTPGIRTRFMTLWQMMIVGALAVTLSSPPESMLNRTTIAIILLQLFITYLWWSVGIYDKQHRQMNKPYTRWYLFAFALLMLTFWVPFPYKRVIFLLALAANYFPFALTAGRLKKHNLEFSLSSNMMERLGSFTIILFGEVILGVVNSVSHKVDLNMHIWTYFGLGILIVFSLWWIFFSTIADRESRKGMWAGIIISFIYIPMLASLGMVGTAFPSLMENKIMDEYGFSSPFQIIFGTSIAIFLCCITMISKFLIHPPEYEKPKKFVQRLLILIGIINLALMLLFPLLPVVFYLLCVFAGLLVVIIVMTRSWFRVELQRLSQEQ